MTAFFLTVFALSGFSLIRNELAFRARMRRIKEIHDLNTKQIGRHDFVEVMERRYAELDRPSYSQMVFDLRCWTYRHFYPSEVA